VAAACLIILRDVARAAVPLRHKSEEKRDAWRKFFSEKTVSL